MRSLLASGYGLVGSVEHLLFASSGIESEIARAAEAVEVVARLTLPVATTGHLIALKLLARDDERRPRDAADLIGLSAVATPEDVAAAEDAVRLISSRGYDRDRDLLRSLDQLALPRRR